jgi:hypothetical protein
VLCCSINECGWPGDGYWEGKERGTKSSGTSAFVIWGRPGLSTYTRLALLPRLFLSVRKGVDRVLEHSGTQKSHNNPVQSGESRRGLRRGPGPRRSIRPGLATQLPLEKPPQRLSRLFSRSPHPDSMSYLRFGRSARSSTAAPVPDFAAFDDEDDNDNDAPILDNSLRHQRVRSRSPSPPSSPTDAHHGAITLGDDFSDPLTSSHQTATFSGHHAAATTLPGSYDFEPQGHEGGAPVVQHRTRAANGGGGDGLGGLDVAAYRRPMSLRERLLPAALYARLSSREEESSGLLFSHDGQDSAEESDAEGRATYPPRGMPSHTPLPARPPQFAAPATTIPPGTRVFGGGQGNDGVFANLSAKPDGMQGNGRDYVGGDDGGDKDEVLPVSFIPSNVSGSATG